MNPPPRPQNEGLLCGEAFLPRPPLTLKFLWPQGDSPALLYATPTSAIGIVLFLRILQPKQSERKVRNNALGRPPQPWGRKQRCMESPAWGPATVNRGTDTTSRKVTEAPLLWQESECSWQLCVSLFRECKCQQRVIAGPGLSQTIVDSFLPASLGLLKVINSSVRSRRTSAGTVGDCPPPFLN